METRDEVSARAQRIRVQDPYAEVKPSMRGTREMRTRIEKVENQLGIAIVAESSMLRESLTASLSVRGFRWITPVSDVNELCNIGNILDLRVVILNADVGCGMLHTRLEQMQRLAPDAAVILFSEKFDETMIECALRWGVGGLMTYDTPIPYLAAVIRATADGLYAMAAQPTATLMTMYREKVSIQDRRSNKIVPMYDEVPLKDELTELASCVNGAVGTLSGRETEVLELIAADMESKEIGKLLNISHNTVRNHVSSIMTKLNVHSRAGAVAEATLLGYLQTQDIVDAKQRIHTTKDGS